MYLVKPKDRIKLLHTEIKILTLFVKIINYFIKRYNKKYIKKNYKYLGDGIYTPIIKFDKSCEKTDYMKMKRNIKKLQKYWY